MASIETCVERCTIVARLPEEVREQILAQHALGACVDMRVGQRGPLCGLPGGRDKDELGRQALAAVRQLTSDTV